LKSAERRNRVSVRIDHPDGEGFRRFLIAAGKDCLFDLGVRRGELSVVLLDDPSIRALNRLWRKKDAVTDVLSFPAGDMPGAIGARKLLGDVALSLDTARARAHRGRIAVQQELRRYLVHGILHLLGYDHRQPVEAKAMAALERRLLGSRGLIPVRR
jgi:probable rRNA maturation factor